MYCPMLVVLIQSLAFSSFGVNVRLCLCMQAQIPARMSLEAGDWARKKKIMKIFLTCFKRNYMVENLPLVVL